MRMRNPLLPGLVISGLLASWLGAQEGPRRESGVSVAKPKPGTAKPEEATEEEKIPSKFSKKDQPDVEGMPTFRSDVLAVTVDVAVLTNKGQFIPNIPENRFRVLEDGVPQQISSFAVGEAPMTVALVIEWSGLFQQYWTETWYQTLSASYGFLETLKPEDYVAVVAYDIRPEILADFSTDKRKVYEAMQRLRIAAFSESNLFDALTDVAQRMEDIEGRKAIVLISSGIDTFSKITFDETRKILQRAGVPIYAVGLMQALREYYDARGWMGPIQRLDFLQADNQMRTFANETGGMAFFPRFYVEFPSIYGSISEALRNQYSIAYNPSNQTRDGKFRKIKVELINPENGERLRITDQKNKNVNYRIIARNGYYAPRPVE